MIRRIRIRFRLPMGRTLFFLSAFAFALVALLPLRLGLDWLGLGSRGFAAREATGSVWVGAVEEAQLGRVSLGDLGTSLETLPLLAGRARLTVRGLDGRRFEGAFTSSRHGFGVDDVTAELSLAGALGPLPIATLDLGDLSVRFERGQCRQAEGRVRAALSGAIAGIPLPALAGAARCEAGLLLLPLASQSATERLELRVAGDGRYRAELRVRPSQPGLGAALTAAGFAPAGDAYALRLSGAF
jgi:general secretion pathway protein N